VEKVLNVMVEENNQTWGYQRGLTN